MHMLTVRFVPQIIAALAAMTLLAPAALAAPPVEGERAPSFLTPETVPYGYVGTALIGPRGYCAPSNGAMLCTSVVHTYVRVWKRAGANKPWRPALTVSNSTDYEVLTMPYGKGWQWVWHPKLGFGVVPANRLSKRWQP